MRKLYSIVASLILTISIFAQAPQQFSYQAVVRGLNNELAVGKYIGMRFSLLQGSNTGNAVYIETHTTLTNANGLISIAIGNGTVVSGTFENIDWSKGPYFVKTETDITGGKNYSVISTSQLLSVPYALFSANEKDEQKLSVSASGDTLYLQNGGFVIIPGISVANAKTIPSPTSGYGPNVTDIDGNTYKTVYIGKQQWMTENLKVSRYNDGTSIANITDNSQWIQAKTGAWCNYDNNVNYDANYGKLYNWFALNPTNNGNKNVCPTKWHVPTNIEWTSLQDYLGGPSSAGGKMKEVGLQHWLSPNTSATNNSLFTALPGGFRAGSFGNFGYMGYWWSSTQSGSTNAYNYVLLSTSEGVSSSAGGHFYGMSIRCIKD
jgi:uncharacterized protein (TIGR02145 family)